MKRFLLGLLIGLTTVQAQMSPQQMLVELIKDLQVAIADSTELQADSLAMSFSETDEVSRYLTRIWQDHEATNLHQDSPSSPVVVRVDELEMSIHYDVEKSSRNKDHIRRLALGARFNHQGQEFQWSGSTSDRLDKTGVRKTVESYFPKEITGDYRTGEAGSLRVILTTLGLFTVLAALYFIRT